MTEKEIPDEPEWNWQVLGDLYYTGLTPQHISDLTECPVEKVRTYFRNRRSAIAGHVFSRRPKDVRGKVKRVWLRYKTLKEASGRTPDEEEVFNLLEAWLCEHMTQDLQESLSIPFHFWR